MRVFVPYVTFFFGLVALAVNQEKVLAHNLPNSDPGSKKMTVKTSFAESSKSDFLDLPTKPEQVEIKNVLSLTLNQAVEIAFKNNIPLQSAKLSLQASRESLRASQAELFPTLTVDTNLQNNVTPAAGYSNPLNANFSPQVSLAYKVLTGGERSARINKAQLELKNSELQVEVISENLRYQVVDEYLQLQDYDVRIKIASETIKEYKEILQDTQMAYQSGLVSNLDVLRVKVQVAQTQQTLAQAIADAENSRRKLVEILNVGEQVQITVSDPIDIAGKWKYSLSESIILAYKNRAELVQKTLTREINQEDRNLAISTILPTLSIYGTYDTYQNFNDKKLGFGPGYVVGLNVHLTLFDGGQALALAREAEKKGQIADTDFADQRDSIRFQVERAYNNLIANEQNIATARVNISEAQEAVRYARLRFQNGFGQQTDVIDTVRDLINSRLLYPDAVIGYNRSLNSLYRAISRIGGLGSIATQ